MSHRELSNLKIIGKGSYGLVFEVFENNTRYALKKIEIKYPLQLISVKNEIQILKNIKNNDCCVQYYDSWIQNIQNKQFYYILFEYLGIPLNSIFYKLAKQDNTTHVKKKLKLSIKIAKAINKLHKTGIAHLDIKPENMMIDTSGNIKIIDFGFSCNSTYTKLDEGKVKCETDSGTLMYADPTMYEKDAYENYYKKSSMSLTVQRFQQADIYSFGVMLYILFNNKDPYDLGTKLTERLHKLHEAYKNKSEIKSKSGISSLDESSLDELIEEILQGDAILLPWDKMIYVINRLEEIYKELEKNIFLF